MNPWDGRAQKSPSRGEGGSRGQSVGSGEAREHGGFVSEQSPPGEDDRARESWGNTRAQPRTSDRDPLGQDGDGTLGHLLQVQDRGDLGAPAVRAHPDEMSRLVRPLGRLQHPPAERSTRRWRSLGHRLCVPVDTGHTGQAQRCLQLLLRALSTGHNPGHVDTWSKPSVRGAKRAARLPHPLCSPAQAHRPLLPPHLHIC